MGSRQIAGGFVAVAFVGFAAMLICLGEREGPPALGGPVTVDRGTASFPAPTSVGGRAVAASPAAGAGPGSTIVPTPVACPAMGSPARPTATALPTSSGRQGEAPVRAGRAADPVRRADSVERVESGAGHD